MTQCQQPASKNARILIVDDHPIVREGMAMFLNQQSNLFVCCMAEDAADAMTRTCTHRHDLAIVDMSLNRDSGLDLIASIRHQSADIGILVISMHEESEFAEHALRCGANGYLMKQEGTLNILRAVNRILGGLPYLSDAMQRSLSGKLTGAAVAPASPLATLSDREFSILHLIGMGNSSREIAHKLNRSVKTIDAHRANIKEKLNISRGRDLERFAMHWLKAD